MGTGQFLQELREMSTAESEVEPKAKVRGPLDVIADALESIVKSIAQSEINIRKDFEPRFDAIERRLKELEIA